MALSVEDLYATYAGRDAASIDPAGLAYWKEQFGDYIDTSEQSHFINAVVANKEQAAPATAPIVVTPDTQIADLYQEVLGRAPESQAVVDKWKGLFGSEVDPTEAAFFKQSAQSEITNPVRSALKGQIINQGTMGNWSGEGFGSPEANADAMAGLLADIGITDINQFGKLPDGSFGNLVTGQAVSNTYGERQTGDAFGGTYAGKGNTGYRVQFTPEGTPVFYTSGQSSNDLANLLGDSKILNLAANAAAAYFGGPAGTAALQLAQGNSVGDAAKAALLSYAGQQAGGLLKGAGAGAGGVSEAAFQAADAAQLAAQGLSEAQIASTLVSSGMSTAGASLAASMAANGLDAATMTQQLDALSTNTGLMSQTGTDSSFAAADALQLQGQVGNNFAAIEQNLIASGVDPLIAADVSQQLAFNPGMTQDELATALEKSYGKNIYDVDMATTYPTSVLPGKGGLLSDVPGYTAPAAGEAGTAAATTPTTGLTQEQISNIIKAGTTLAGVGATTGLLTQGGGAQAPLQAPTQGMPSYGPEYYNQLQQYYSSYMPQAPRDVVGPLQQWYNSPKAV